MRLSEVMTSKDTVQVDLAARIERQAEGVRDLLGEGDVIAGLEGADWIAQDAEALKRGLVRQARAQGQSWEVIGRALGISRQAAHERYAAPDLD